MALRPNILSICTGAGGLDLGVRLACEGARTVCYVEREAFAVANLVAAMEDGFMDEAPVWSDLRTFDGRPWRGTVDWLVGGIPCQPHSAAGRHLGADDDRDLWPDTARIIREIRPEVCFLENVPGILRYYFDTVGPELRALGYDLEEGLFSADEVGDSQERQRLFVLAHAGGARSRGWGLRPGPEAGRLQPEAEAKGSERELAGADGVERSIHLREGRCREPESETGWGVKTVACGVGNRRRESGRPLPSGQPESERSDEHLAGGDSERRNQGEHPLRPGRSEALRSGPDVTGTVGERRQGMGRAQQEERLKELGSLFPPSPDDLETWTHLLTEMPSLEPAFCRDADGVAWWLDATAQRTQRLRVLGNGVVPLVAAHAFRTLAARAVKAP